jgi:hypothetical protein
MLFVRRLAAFVTQNAVQAYHTLSTSLGQPPSQSYQPLGHDILYNYQNTKNWFRRNRKALAYLALALSTLAAIIAYWRAAGAAIVETSNLPELRIPREQYIQAILRNPVVGVFDPEPIRAKCNETKFQEGLVWECAVVIGGIGNVANMLLNCVRYAIEAGGTYILS